MKRRQRATHHWHRLDNTANLFPVITSKKFSNVYRLSITLQEDVTPELLQQALTTVLPWFPSFHVRLRHGFFWSYLEANHHDALIAQEDDYPCQYINPHLNNQFLFRVTYFANRINLEVFHVLTDGTGGLRFLQALCCQYLLLAHPEAFTSEEKDTHWFAQHATNTEDSYVSHYAPTKKSTFKIGKAFKLKGERNLLQNLSVIHAYIPLPPLLAHCRSKGVSITQYITACLAWAVYKQQLGSRPPKHPVNIFMPVNLRNLFDSSTSLNFFSNIYISLSYKEEEISFESILQEVKSQFEEKITKEEMLQKISYTVGSGYSPFVRAVPLPFKNIALRVIYETSAKSSTLGFSNVGKIVMPSSFQPFVSGASFILSTAPREPLKCGVCSYGDMLTLSFTSILRSTALQKAMLRCMSQDGLDVVVESNGVDYENL